MFYIHYKHLECIEIKQALAIAAFSFREKPNKGYLYNTIKDKLVQNEERFTVPTNSLFLSKLF